MHREQRALEMVMHYTALLAIAASLHYLWESSHVRFYTAYTHLSDMPITLYATFGDVLYTLILVLIVALLKRKLDWWTNVHWTDILALAIMGFFTAAFVEYKALALNRWEYLPSMPIIPLLNIGLSPVVQMTVLLPITVLFARFFSRQ